MLFISKARRRAHSRAYATEAPMPEMYNGASKIGNLFLDDPIRAAEINKYPKITPNFGPDSSVARGA